MGARFANIASKGLAWDRGRPSVGSLEMSRFSQKIVPFW